MVKIFSNEETRGGSRQLAVRFRVGNNEGRHLPNGYASQN